MEDIHTYQILVRGRVEADDILSISPPGLVFEPMEEFMTGLSICTDQSGLIGLIRHLHGLGLVLLSVRCCEA